MFCHYSLAANIKEMICLPSTMLGKLNVYQVKSIRANFKYKVSHYFHALAVAQAPLL